ncbi:MAG: hypothetical protein HKN58_08385 [Xanthomonadales bacterium]|nr:hypothetical protein [Xanthomonadales bacterium]
MTKRLPRNANGARPARLCAAWVGLLACLVAAGASAQDGLPSVEDVAMQVADPVSRTDTLYRLAATARLVQHSTRGEAGKVAEQLVDDALWLRQLAGRYGATPQRSPVLDPPAWLIQLELSQRDLPVGDLVSPLGPEITVYVDQVFNRSSARIAAVVLPELLWRLEPEAAVTWRAFLDLLAQDADLAAALEAEPPAWIEEWVGSAAAAPAAGSAEAIDSALATLDGQVEAAVRSGPPDVQEWVRLRHRLILAVPGLTGTQRADAISVLRLSVMIDGLHEGRFFAFAEGLISLATELLARAATPEGQVSRLPAWLVGALPSLSATYARAFANVDPRLNSAVAAAFDVLNELTGSDSAELDRVRLQRALADASAQLSLLIPDLAYYFGLPVRDAIAGGMDACTGLMARQETDGSPAMTRELYDDCQQTLVDLADREARTAALAGDFSGPFGADTLQRELRVTSGQRINYGIGYLHDRYATGCALPGQRLPNPLEWSALATLVAWFAEQSPIYFKTPENEARLARMKRIGDELLRVVAEQVDCLAGAGAAVNDPVSRTLVDYRSALVAVGSGISNAIDSYRRKALKPGADVVLQADATQATAYRPDDLMIGPCDREQVCEMNASLPSTRALLGLFPEQYLVADQVRFGSVEICYDDVSWVNRRSAPVRADDTNVANYFGQLSFRLLGRYRSGEQVEDIFGFRFTSPSEHHYLFAANSEEVLADACPVEWIGQRIVTPLRGDHSRIVPNRLTYLAAPRMQPSRLLALNWDRGAEWRDWFITGIGVEPLDMPEPADITGEVNQQLRSLHRNEQAAIYDTLLRPPTRGVTPLVPQLYDESSRLSTVKALMRQQMTLFYPQLLLESDALRSAVAGHGGLLDNTIISRFNNDNVAVDDLNSLAFARLEAVEQAWRAQPELIRRTGSVAGSLAHAMMRLNALYERHFAAPPEAPAEVSAESAD